MRDKETREVYRKWSNAEPSVPIFSKGWWLDAIAPGTWSSVIIENKEAILAAMPFTLKAKAGFTLLGQPPLTQNLGPWIRPSSGKYSKRLAREKDLMEALIEGLPKYDRFQQHWHYNINNWLPFYWKGFTQTTRYTYVIENISNIDDTFSNFDHSKRKNIKKAEQLIKVVWDISPDTFYENHKMTLSKQGQNISYGYSLFSRLYDAAYSNNSGRTLAAYDYSGNLHAALFIVYDTMSGYDLISTIDTDFRNSGAASLLVFEAIKYVSELGISKFDFEGSMIEPVERSFRQFGAVQKPYHSVSKTPSFCLRTLSAARTALNTNRS